MRPFRKLLRAILLGFAMLSDFLFPVLNFSPLISNSTRAAKAGRNCHVQSEH